MKKISFNIPDADERGVSPVIGVILMVAITVILAAVIATFVLGFPDQVNDNVKAGADISVESQGNGTVTWISGGTADHLNVSVGGESTNYEKISNVGGVISFNTGTSTTGSSGDGDLNTTSDTVTIVVTAVKGDTRTVVQKEEVSAS